MNALGNAHYPHTDLVQLLKEAEATVEAFNRNANIAVENWEESRAAECEQSSSLRELYDGILKIQAPMVRCSRPAFRKLCRLWGTSISYTHMIMAESFSKSASARDADFALYTKEDKLVVQLASSDGPEAARAAAFLQPYCDAMDINCGCPQKWAIQEGVGVALLEQPEQVADIVRCVRNATAGVAIPCVVKMRVKDDIRQSVDFARQCVAAGASWLTVHGRTPQCSSSAPVRWDSIRHIREAVSVPVVANGAVVDPTSALHTAVHCNVGSVMSGNGLLDNPAAFYSPHDSAAALQSFRFLPTPSGLHAELYSHTKRLREEPVLLRSTSHPLDPLHLCGLPVTPIEVISDFARLAIDTDLSPTATVHHLLRMGRAYFSPAERSHLALLRSNVSVLAALEESGMYTSSGKYVPHQQAENK